MIPAVLLCLAAIGYCSIDTDPFGYRARRRQLRKSMRGSRLHVPWRLQ